MTSGSVAASRKYPENGSQNSITPRLRVRQWSVANTSITTDAVPRTGQRAPYLTRRRYQSIIARLGPFPETPRNSSNECAGGFPRRPSYQAASYSTPPSSVRPSQSCGRTSKRRSQKLSVMEVPTVAPCAFSEAARAAKSRFREAPGWIEGREAHCPFHLHITGSRIRASCGPLFPALPRKIKGEDETNLMATR